MLLNFTRSTVSSTFKICDPFGIKLLPRLQLGFGHLSKHKFRHNFAVSLNPLCSYSLWTNSKHHFFFFPTLPELYCFAESTFNWIESINNVIISLNENDLLHLIIHEDKNFDSNMDTSILTATVKFIKDSERFDQPPFKPLSKPFLFIYSHLKFFAQNVCCITIRIFDLISYSFNCAVYKWTVRVFLYNFVLYIYLCFNA